MSFISFKRLALKVGIAIIILLILYLLTKLGISSIVPCTLTPPVIVSLRFGDHHQLLKLVLNPFQDFLAFDELTMSLHVHPTIRVGFSFHAYQQQIHELLSMKYENPRLRLNASSKLLSII